MTDLTDRLRNRSYRLATRDMNGDGASLALEAANRIADLERVLSHMTREMRKHATQSGPMHAWWDSIMDAGALLNEKQTLKDWTKP